MEKSLVLNYGKIVNRLNCNILIKKPFEESVKNCQAVWDTGAMTSAVSKKLYDELQLQMLEKTFVASANGTAQSVITVIDIILPNGLHFESVKATVCNLPKSIDVLLGMDIITLGTFPVASDKIKTLLTFYKDL